MKRNQILAIAFSALGLFSYPYRVAHAGWFGPSNYDECLIDKMKGQTIYMLGVAQGACLKLFPPPPKAPEPSKAPELVLLNKDFIKWETRPNSDSTGTFMTIIDKPSGYTITAVVGSFISRSPCVYNTYDNIHQQNQQTEEDRKWLRLRGSKLESPDTYGFSIAGSQFNCVDMTFYGFLK
jgi:hypothetical protein